MIRLLTTKLMTFFENFFESLKILKVPRDPAQDINFQVFVNLH